MDFVPDPFDHVGGRVDVDGLPARRTKGRNYGRLSPAALGAASVTEFGAVADGSRSDHQSIQDALDTCRNVYFPPGNYRLDKPVTVRCARQLIYGPGGLREGSDNTGDRVARLFTPLGRGALINVQSHMVAFKGLSIEGTGRDSDIVAIEFRKQSNTGDVDGRVIDCVLRQFAAGVRVIGRGLRAENNVFVSLTDGIQLAWPTKGVEQDEENDPFNLQDLPYGMRAFFITSNRVHSCSTFLVNEGSRSENRLWGLELTNNLIDVGDALFRGGATYSNISNNVVAHCNKTILSFTGACHHTTISSNILSGHPELAEKQPRHAIRFDNNCHDLTISTNVVVNIKSNAMVFGADRQNYITIQGNTFDNIGTTNSEAKVVLFTKSAGDFSITGNTFKPGGRNRQIIWANDQRLSGFEVMGNAYQRNSVLMAGFIGGGFNSIQG